MAGPALFTLAWIVLGFLNPGYTLFGIRIEPYSPISQPSSGLGLVFSESLGARARAPPVEEAPAPLILHQ